MEMPPNARRHFAQKHIEDAARYVDLIEEARLKESENDRRAFERFYNNLALFSGGTMALSVTFLGYLKTLSKPVRYQPLLTGSWVALFICLVCSFAFVFWHLSYVHYSRSREYCEALKKKYETEAAEIRFMSVANIQTEKELSEYQKPRIEAARISEEQARWNKCKEKRYQGLWVWAGRIACTGFVAGIALLVCFAVVNT
ncbi:MAG: hypothetical protein ACRD4S_00605 [Candidatus Acidiferrales bacterium]